MSAVLTEILNILTSGIATYAQGFGAGLADTVEAIFLTTGEGGALALSTTGGIIVIFGALALAINLTKMVFNWVSSLGASR